MKLHVTANTLASFITAKTPERKRSIVRNARRAAQKPKDYAPYYQSLKTPARNFLQGGAKSPAQLHSLIETMKKRTQTEEGWHKIDSRVTAKAAEALIRLAPKLRELDVIFALRGPGIKATLEFPDIDVIATPDMLVEKVNNGVRLIGAMRFYTAKESAHELGQKGAELIAVMQYQWLLKVATGKRMPDHSLCMVLECFQQRVTTAPADSENLVKAIEQGCRDFVRLWNTIDEKDAA
jgi:hypothetical protein